MKSDVNGCSTCLAGMDKWENYYDRLLKRFVVQYDYRTPAGELFSCCAKTLDDARRQRDAWLAKEVSDGLPR